MGFLPNVFDEHLLLLLICLINLFSLSHVIVVLFLTLVNVVNEIIVSHQHSLPGPELYLSTLAHGHDGRGGVGGVCVPAPSMWGQAIVLIWLFG